MGLGRRKREGRGLGAAVCDTGCTYFRNGCILSALDKQIKHLTQKQSVASAQGWGGEASHKENTTKRASHT